MAKQKPRKSGSPSGQKSGKIRSHDPVVAALELAALQGWRRTTLSDIAARAGLSLAELHAQYRSRHEILAAWLSQLDAGMLAGRDPDEASAGSRDRLFAVIMRRFDALDRHKTAIRAIARDLIFDPADAFAMACAMRRSLIWMLEAAGLESTGIKGQWRLNGLSLIYGATWRVWLRDDGADLSKTMAALDRGLRRAETAWNRLCAGWPVPSKRRQETRRPSSKKAQPAKRRAGRGGA
jgi:AcrR family transcriptional regulator